MDQEHGSHEDLGSPTEPDSDLRVRYEEAIGAVRRQKVRRSGKMVDSGLQKNMREMEDDIKRILQLQSFDAADKDSRSLTEVSRVETPCARSDQQASMPPVEPSRRKRRRSGEAVLERPFKSRKPQRVLPPAGRGKNRGGEKAVFDVQGYTQALEDHKENIGPIRVLCDDDGRVVGIWRDNLQIDLPRYRFRIFYGVDRVPSVGSFDPSMRRTVPERFSGAGPCEPSQNVVQSNQTSTMYSATMSRTVTLEDKRK